LNKIRIAIVFGENAVQKTTLAENIVAITINIFSFII